VTVPLPDPARVANLDQLVSATESVVANGPASGCRAIDLRVYRGIDVRVLPDRGCDLGAAWFRGVPLSWTSAVGERAPFAPPSGEEWLDAFGGGLVTTCGLRNVGWASEGVGLHGVFSHQRARVVEVDRRFDGDGAVAVVRAVIRDASHARWHLEVERTITTQALDGVVELVDVTRNRGAEPEPSPLLYHVNVGAPLWDEGARLEMPHSRGVRPDAAAAEAPDDWSLPPEPSRAPERGYEHVIAPGPDGWAQARVVNARVGVELTLSWDVGALPRFNQWVQPVPGVYVLGLEPMNCSVQGRAHDRAEGTLPILQPGEERVTRLAICARELDGDPTGA
jgi:Domain of unknown function (DUF4432)